MRESDAAIGVEVGVAPVSIPGQRSLSRSRRRFYSVAEVAAMFGLSTMTLYRAIAAGEFPEVKVRGRVIVPVEAVEAMTEAALAEGTMVDAAEWSAS